MAEDGRECALRIITREGKCIRVAYAGSTHLHHDLTGLGSIEVHLDNFKRFTGLEGHCGSSFHIDS